MVSIYMITINIIVCKNLGLWQSKSYYRTIYISIIVSICLISIFFSKCNRSITTWIFLIFYIVSSLREWLFSSI
nr:MAG TPA: hypothetical protein [Bacteriophage sp.]